MFGAVSPSTIALAVGYAYVTVMIVRAEYLANDGFKFGSVVKAAAWPATIIHSITKLYETKPR